VVRRTISGLATFGEQWVEHGAVPILVLFCLAGIPLAFNESCSQYLRAKGRPGADLRWYLPFTVAYTFALLIGVRFGITGAAVAVLFMYLINAPVYYWVNLRHRSSVQQPTPSIPMAEAVTQQ